MRDRVRVYREIWSRIENVYFDGYLFNEGTLQAELYTELRKELPGVHIVVEPRWKVGNDPKKPDLVIVEKGQITDIFELKIWSTDERVQKDIEKLLRYGANNETYLVRYNPNTGGEWEELPVLDSCRLHSVVVAWYDRERNGERERNRAVWPEGLRNMMRDLKEETPALRENTRVLNHWFGRLGGDTAETRKWSIEVGIR